MRWLILICVLGTGLLLDAQNAIPARNPDLDSAIRNSKPFLRIEDYNRKRKVDGSRQQALWHAWQKHLDADRNSRAREEAKWENFGPDTVSGRIISIDFHPSDPNTWLVGSASGGLWRTQDYGQTWEPLTDELMTLGVGAVAYNPQNPSSILIATGEGYGFGGEFSAGFGVFKSEDGGNTWRATELDVELSSYFAGMDIYWNPSDSNKVAIASSFGNYYSDDAGETYLYTLDRLGGRMIPDPMDPNRLYFSARYYGAPYPGGFYISENSGATWDLIDGTGLPNPNDFGYASIAVHPTYNHIIYLSVSNSYEIGSGPLFGLYKSSDYGETWTEIPSSTDYLCYPFPYQYICLGWYANTISIAPMDTNRLFAGGTRLWTSTNGGQDWTAIDVNSLGTAYAVHPDHHQTVFHPITGDLIDCNDGGVDYSDDYGESWTSAADGLITHQFYTLVSAETNSEVILGGTQDVGTFSTTSAHGAGKWDNEFSGDAFGHAIDHQDDQTWYGTNYINLQRIKSEDAGLSWLPINNGTSGLDQWRMPIEMHPVDPEIILSSNDQYIYRTENGGDLWEQVYSQGFIGSLAFDPINTQLVYASELFGSKIYLSSNEGNSWTELSASPGFPITELACDPFQTGKLYATIGSFAEGEQVFVSDDFGASWSNISWGLPSVPVNAVALSPVNADEIFVGNDLGVWYSENAGLTWTAYNDGLPAAVIVEDMHYYEPDNTLRVGTYGRGYWRSPAPGFISGINEEQAVDLKITPNPSNGVFNLNHAIEAEVYDINGRKLMDIQGLRIDLSPFPSGSYWLRHGEKSYSLFKLE
jgi:photosystem II stability/assembly factor-like uncharacterized protein